MHIVQVSGAYEADLVTPEALLARYETLGAWSEALLAAGASRATVVQRFARDVEVERGGVRFLFRRDGGRPFPRPWTPLRRLARAVAETQADLVHVNGLVFPAALRGLRKALPAETRLVVQDHASAGPPRDVVRRSLWRSGLRAADAFLFTAREQADPWRAAGLIRAAQAVHEVPEASRAVQPRAYAEAREESRLAGEPAVVWVGHLDGNKDPMTVLEGFAQALADLPRAFLTLVFRGEALRRTIEARLAADAVLAAHVALRGTVPPSEMSTLLSAADVFVLGSHKEGSGYALMEAMACGALPVVTDIPPHRVLTGGGTLGRPSEVPPLLWPVGDAAALRHVLARLGRRHLGPLRAAARAHFERELSWLAVGRRALAAYRAVSAASG
jgi:glycosyltransferase involved in cell wall biosynthesis